MAVVTLYADIASMMWLPLLLLVTLFPGDSVQQDVNCDDCTEINFSDNSKLQSLKKNITWEDLQCCKNLPPSHCHGLMDYGRYTSQTIDKNNHLGTFGNLTEAWQACSENTECAGFTYLSGPKLYYLDKDGDSGVSKHQYSRRAYTCHDFSTTTTTFTTATSTVTTTTKTTTETTTTSSVTTTTKTTITTTTSSTTPTTTSTTSSSITSSSTTSTESTMSTTTMTATTTTTKTTTTATTTTVTVTSTTTMSTVTVTITSTTTTNTDKDGDGRPDGSISGGGGDDSTPVVAGAVAAVVVLLLLACLFYVFCIVARRDKQADDKRTGNYNDSLPTGMIANEMHTLKIPGDNPLRSFDEKTYENMDEASEMVEVNRTPNVLYNNDGGDGDRVAETSADLPPSKPPIEVAISKGGMFVDACDIDQFNLLETNMAGQDALPPFISSQWKKYNRYRNISPNPATRVPLHELHGDPTTTYINANFIRGAHQEPRRYIAAQGPKVDTIDNFWRVIWDQNVRVIVMVTALKEGGKDKCARYWPTKKYKPDTDKDYTVHCGIKIMCITGERDEYYKVAELDVQHNGETRRIAHFWFDSWPDYGVPANALAVPLMLKHVRERSDSPQEPWLVHCSAGIGRTGAFVAIDMGMRQLEESHNCKLLEVIKQMREDRGGMIQTEEQYIFVHKALEDYAVASNAALWKQKAGTEVYGNIDQEKESVYSTPLTEEESIYETVAVRRPSISLDV